MNLVNKLIEALYSGVSLGGAAVAYNYQGEAEWFTKGYLHDVTLPFGIYFFNKLINSSLGQNQWVNAGFVFLACSAAEATQALGFYGTYDPKDFLAYGAGAVLAVTADKATFRKKDLDTLVDDTE